MTEILEALEMIGFTSDWTGVIALLAYILEAWALYTIANRREIRKPWLSWIPVVNVWILGSISDQYHYVTKREVKNKRKLLLGLAIAVTVLLLLVSVLLIWMVVELILIAGGTMTGWISVIEGGNYDQLLQVADGLMIPMLLVVLLGLPLLILLVMLTVHQWIATYDLFRSCDPSNAKVYLIVGILGGFVVEGVHTIFMMICRNKDLGMPPRKTEVVEEAPSLPEEPLIQE